MIGETGGLNGASKRSRSVEFLSKASEAGEGWGESVSFASGGEPGMVSNSVLAHIDCENSSSGEARRSIGGSFLEKRESRASWGTRFSDREGECVLRWILEVVVDAEDVDEAGERGRGMSYEPRERERVLETNLFERSR